MSSSTGSSKSLFELSTHQKFILRQSWRDLMEANPATGRPAVQELYTGFYDRLFRRDPSSRAVFGNASTEKQGAALVGILSSIIKHLDSMESVRDSIEKCGERHAKYGVSPSHFDYAQGALLDTMEEMLGPEKFTKEVRDAWSIGYSNLSALLKKGLIQKDIPQKQQEDCCIL